MANNQGIITEIFPQKERGKAFGLSGTAVALGSLLEPGLQKGNPLTQLQIAENRLFEHILWIYNLRSNKIGSCSTEKLVQLLPIF